MSPFPIFKYLMRNKVRRSVDFTAFPHSLFSSSQFREVGRTHVFRAILLRRNVTFIGCPRSPRLYVAKAGCDAYFSASEFRALLTIPSWPCSMWLFTDSSYIDLIQGDMGSLLKPHVSLRCSPRNVASWASWCLMKFSPLTSVRAWLIMANTLDCCCPFFRSQRILISFSVAMVPM